jgi:hypothetical protein
MAFTPSPFRRFLSLPWIAEIVTLLGATGYLIQSWIYAHTQASILDEGAYLYKGYLFATGQYVPFQEYGPWNNHMPLSFLIPGYIQSWFGPGLRTGRYFSIALGLLLLLGLWIVAKRLGGNWWAAGAVWALTLNPYFSSVYSLAFSQVLVACILIWIMVLVLDDRAALWRIALGSALAAILIITRINTALILPMLIIFIFWQHGVKAGITATVSGGLTLIVGHAPFFPGIMRLWATWLPYPLKPLLNTQRGLSLGRVTWNPQIPFELRLLSFWSGIRLNFIPMVGLLGFGLLSFQRKSWKSAFYHRTAVFLTILIACMTSIHAWASLSKNYCVFCFPGYLTFFSPLIFLLIIITFKGWEGRGATWFSALICILVIVVSAGIGYANFQEIGPLLSELAVPRVKDGRLVGGFAPLWGVLEGTLGLQIKTTQALLPVLTGLLVGVILLLIMWGIYRWRKASAKSVTNFGFFALSIFLAVGLFLSPTKILGGDNVMNDCRGDVVAAEEAAGRHLAAVIPPGSQVYWHTPPSVVPLLYALDVNVYLPQINGNYALHQGGDEDDLLKLGLWNIDLSRQWKSEADYIIIEGWRYDSDWNEYFLSEEYVELPPSPNIDPCHENSMIRIFRRESQ